jgi:hypothetical protein
MPPEKRAPAVPDTESVHCGDAREPFSEPTDRCLCSALPKGYGYCWHCRSEHRFVLDEISFLEAIEQMPLFLQYRSVGYMR